MNEYTEERNEKGFTLIELLIAIVVVGILAAVAIVGIGGLTKTGGASACKATADAANTASAAYYAANDNKWPTSFGDMTSGGDNAVLQLQANVTGSGDTLTNGDWNLKGTFGGTGSKPVIDASASGNCKNP